MPFLASPHLKPILADRLARFPKNLKSRSATSYAARSCNFFALLKKDRFRRGEQPENRKFNRDQWSRLWENEGWAGADVRLRKMREINRDRWLRL
jgi:hypothetical protein